jgi:glycosyltransferase involved in cell wall biosynthesis
MAAGVSILVCSYNGAKRLPKTLEHLALQHVPADILWEVIVVDNASTDDTTGIAKSEWAKYRLPRVGFSVLQELNPGKNNALDKGINNALYDYILICDDDNWLNADYIEKAYRIMQSDDRIGAAGGQGIGVSDVEFPAWFKNDGYAYAVGKQNPVSGDISAKKYLWGAGMIFRKSLYIKAYSKSPSLLSGPQKDLVTRGEDVEFCLRLLILGYTLFYDDSLMYQHYIPQNRLTDNYRKKLMSGFEDEAYILYLYSKMMTITHLNPFRKLMALFSGATRYLITKIYPNKRWSTAYESEGIYLLTGIELGQISIESKRIKNIFLQLTAVS